MKKLTIILIVILMMIFPIKANAAPLEEIVEDIEAIERQDNSYSKTMKLANKSKQVIEELNVDLSEKKITALGDSITEANGWLEEVQKITGCNICNLGIGGTAIADYWDENSFILRWQQIPSDSDIIIIFGGINDYFIGENFGDRGEEKTYCGDTWNLFSNINAAYPNSQKYVVLNYRSESENWEQFGGRNMQPYIEIQRQYANELGFNVIDLYSNGFMDSRDLNTREILVPDGVHPNELGSKILAYKIISEIALKN